MPSKNAVDNLTILDALSWFRARMIISAKPFQATSAWSGCYTESIALSALSLLERNWTVNKAAMIGMIKSRLDKIDFHGHRHLDWRPQAKSVGASI